MFAHPWETSLASLRLCSHVKLLPKTFFKIHLDNFQLLPHPTTDKSYYASMTLQLKVKFNGKDVTYTYAKCTESKL